MRADDVVAANDFVAQWRAIQADALSAMTRVGESGWYILGREVEQFEVALARFWGLDTAIGCASGLDAIELSLRCLGLRHGELVLTTPFSAFATTLAIVRAGGVPVFVDVDTSGCIDLAAAEACLREHPEIRWFVPVHLYGHALDLERLADLQQRFDLRIVEDCAQSIGASSRGVPTGGVGQMVATSFYPTKNLGALGDGGAILTRSTELATRARCLRDYGQTAKYEHSELGLNSRLDELHAAVLHDALLPRLQAFTARRKDIAARYEAEIANPAVELPAAPAGSASVWHLFPVLVDAPERFIAHLRTKRVAGGRHYPRLIPHQPALAGVEHRVVGAMTMAERFAQHEVSLPIHPFLTDDDVTRVIDACRAFA